MSTVRRENFEVFLNPKRYLRVQKSPLQILRSVFGYGEFRGDQEAVIYRVIDGGDALVLMPTGGGKSLCYQIPSIIRSGVGVVVSPLIALMQDQVHAMQQLGVKCTFINSTLTPEEANIREQMMRQNQYDLVYVAPERLMTNRFLNVLSETQLALFAIDEAHCVSQWGHDFRPEYIRLAELRTRFPEVPYIALTATADRPTRQEIVERLDLSAAQIFSSSFNRPNISYRVLQKNNARQQLLKFLRSEHPDDSGIVYCLSRKRVEDVTKFLQQNGYGALPYHAGLPVNIRGANQTRFLREEKIIIVATIAFGMGIDKPEVRFVAHLDMPKSVEAYYQETGRAGRDGLPADAWMSYGMADVTMLRQLMAMSNAEERIKRIERHKLDAMLGYCETTKCRRQVLLDYFGEQLNESCGNCDTCLEPVETWEGSEVAQKALSCVYRTGQRFGVAYLVDVLLGNNNHRVIDFGHDRVSTFGIGLELDTIQWKSVYRQLVAAGLLAVDIEGHGGLKLTAKSRPVLRGEEPILFRKDPLPTARSRPERRAKKFSLQPSDTNGKALWEALRSMRMTLAQDQNVPPYVIFHDTTLNDIITYRPRTLEELNYMSGIGQSKLEKYGKAILSVIEKHDVQWSRPDDIPPLPMPSSHSNAMGVEQEVKHTMEITVDLFTEGKSIEQIARQRELKETTIYSHLAAAIESGEVELPEVVKLSEDDILTIECAFRELTPEDANKLKPVFESLNEKFHYGTLKCVRAAMIVRGEFTMERN